MTIFMAAFAILIAIMFIGTIFFSLHESEREARDLHQGDGRHRIF